MHSVLRDRSTGPADGHHATPPSIWQDLADLGLTRLSVSADNGGSGATWRESAAMLRAAAYQGVQLPLAENDVLAGWLVDEVGLAGDVALRTVALADSATGSARVPWARAADRVVVVWPSSEGWRLADLPSSELTVTPAHNTAHEPRDELRFDADRCESITIDREVVHELRLRGSLARSVQMTGALERIVELCLIHTRQRHQFGRPLAAFQIVQSTLADIAAETALAMSAVDAAVSAFVEGEPASRGLAVHSARSTAGHASSRVVRSAHQLHGAIGTTEEHDLHRYTLPAVAWRSEFGTVQGSDDALGEMLITAAPGHAWSVISGPSGT
ncbi:acyl-CoA dehydrogenase family protein [Aeromicrobium sp. CF4.19]|uniref:acyl-CoA dehydrogenase family protein n=1 Tax=Aeromicrobium sp. CF4.19 TaxID=3373082 RepID=UPI003EE5B063